MIRFIQIFGERYSGTNYLAALIALNMPQVEVTNAFGEKHWFIKNHLPRCRPNNSTDFQCVRPLEDSDDTLFVIITRNCFDWLRSLAVNPYHATGHLGVSFSRFIRKPWLSFECHRVNADWPDSADEYYFIEEAENILTLRTMKLVHWRNLRHKVKHVAYVNYEALREDLTALADTAEKFGIALAGKDMIDEHRYCCGGAVSREPFAPRKYRAIDPEDLEFIKTHLDWQTEQKYGYCFDDYTENRRDRKSE